MGARGCKPTPTATLKMRGSWRGDKNKQEPKAKVCIPEPPAWLNGVGLQEWNYIAPRLEKGRVLTDWDRNALAGYCQCMADYLDALVTLQKIEGTGRMLIKTTNGNVIQNPLIGIKNKAWGLVQKAAAEFGLTPSSRGRIEAGEGDTVVDGKAKFFRAG